MKEIIKIPEIKLDWSKYHTLDKIKEIDIPKSAGVYRVKYNDEIIHIGKASSLRRRVKYEFVNGDGENHSAKKRILKEGKINLKEIEIQWALTDWPNSVEEYLHKKFKEEKGKLPKYTKAT